jgi:hypothetical protein
MKYTFILFLGLLGNCLRAQVIPVGFLKTPRAPFVAPAIVMNGLILYLDAANPSSYAGSGSTWSNLITGNSVANFTLNNATYTSNNGGVIKFPSTGGFAKISTCTGFANLTRYTVALGGWATFEPTTNYGSDLNNWVQIVVTYNGFVLSLYRNGGSLGSSNTNINLRATLVGYYIAHRWDISDGVYGDYSMVNMYSRALIVSDVTTNYKEFKS